MKDGLFTQNPKYYEENTMNKNQIIQAIINANLDLCQSDSSYNDGFIYDLLMDGFKGLSNMTEQELRAELSKLEEITA